MRRSFAPIAVAAGTLLVCSSSPAARSHEASGAATRDCSITETRALVGSFVRAFNRGEMGRLNALFALAASFTWYSTDGPGKRLGEAAYKRATLVSYFAARHAKRERLTLTSWQGGVNANGYSHFQFFLTREVRDLAPTRYEGKGAIICSDAGDTIAVWSMGRRSS